MIISIDLILKRTKYTHLALKQCIFKKTGKDIK